MALGITNLTPVGPISVNTAGFLDWLKSAAQAINPFSWLNDALHSFEKGLLTTIQVLIINPQKPSTGEWTNYLYGNALGVTPMLITGVIIVLFVVAMFLQRKLGDLLHAILTAVILGGLTPVWFGLCRFVIDSGNELAVAAKWYHGSSGNGGNLSLPQFQSIVGGLVGLILIFIFGGILVLVVLTYPLIALGVEFAGLPALALTPINERTNKWFGRVVALGFVSMFIGRPVAVAIVDVGKALSDHGPLAGTSTGQVIYLVTSLILAIVAQFKLLKAANRIYGKVSGQIRSNVRGVVETTTRQRQQVEPRNINAAHANTMRPVTPSSDVSSRAGSKPVRNAVKNAALAKAASVHPYAGAAITTAQAFTKARKQSINRPQGRKRP